MIWRMPAVLAICFLCAATQGDELDKPPRMNEDPRCLERKAAEQAFAKSLGVRNSKGKPCPPDPETVRQRDTACRADIDAPRLSEFITAIFEPGSSMLSKGVPYIIEKLGDPVREEQHDGSWDIDIYEIPRTLYFPGVTVVTRDYVSDAVDFDLSTGTVKPTNAIYELLVEQGNYEFSHGLTLHSYREDVEAVLGLPCRAVAHNGRMATRNLGAYSYTDTSNGQRTRYSVTFNFDDAGRIESVRWYYDSVWH